MKNKMLFMMFTLLGAPGFVIAGDSDLASSEYNFAINEFIKQGAFGNTAMIIQKGSGNRANITQYGTQKTAVVVQRQSQMAIRVIQR
ncbi:MAG: hypothetical protein E6543_24160 [Enterobacter hormaechei]|nr:hypothetical protein [Enterobacter hormaechei]